MEVAIKMAFRKYLVDQNLPVDTFDSRTKPRLVVLAQNNCYHGDTLGTMHVANPSVFNSRQHAWYRNDAAVFTSAPTIQWMNGSYEIRLPEGESWQSVDSSSIANFSNSDDVLDIMKREDTPVGSLYRSIVQKQLEIHHSVSSYQIAALLIEPVILGAGGMCLIDPLYQKVLVQECRKKQIPIIYDEVFSGCWRLGKESGRDFLKIDPDISCFAKLLTGGVVPMSVTLASKAVFDTFSASPSKMDALLHGHSFTANPVGCSAALFALDQYQQFVTSKNEQRRYWDDSKVCDLSKLPSVARTISIGTVFALEFESEIAGYNAESSRVRELIRKLHSKSIYARPLGNVVYVMCSPLTEAEYCKRILDEFYCLCLEL